MTAITWMKHNCCKVLPVLIVCITLPAVSVGLLCVPFMCSTYECYLYIKGILVMICTTVVTWTIFVSSIVLLSYVAIFKQIKEYWNKISPVIKLVFSNFLKKPNSEGEEEKFVVLGYEASLKEMHWLFYILVQASLLAIAQFWDDFLLEVSSSCSTDSNLHCFYTTDSQLPYQNLNCSNTSQVEEAASIVCYQYVFNIGRAAASAIGIMSATGLIIYAVCIVFLKVLDGARLSKQSIRYAKVVAVVEVLIFFFVLGGLQVTFATRATDTFGKINLFLKTQGIGVLIASSILLFPVDKFRKSENKQRWV